MLNRNKQPKPVPVPDAIKRPAETMGLHVEAYDDNSYTIQFGTLYERLPNIIALDVFFRGFRMGVQAGHAKAAGILQKETDKDGQN